MWVEIYSKYTVVSVIKFIKDKSTTAIAQIQGQKINYTGTHFWAREYAILTIGLGDRDSNPN